MRIEGYAALFGVADLEGDVICAGAFTDSLRERASIPMLLRHQARLLCGVWDVLCEDGRGLRVEGSIQSGAPAGLLAQRLVCDGLDGLSIGFRTRSSAPRRNGRTLYAIDLIEISLVPEPMAPRARLFRVRPSHEKEMFPCEKKPRWPQPAPECAPTI